MLPWRLVLVILEIFEEASLPSQRDSVGGKWNLQKLLVCNFLDETHYASSLILF